ncbi:integrase family protein [Desulfofarcimen acetoxidans DSM 771]|uniref:Integrase family protein n=1 Tax=Desulfofarcimen acetoxidans (strain ATCC 49208 / DSM 771 / KCTC 5769 / VKM B-1644 / 5575) TaxID=485916 RepID=C8VVH5_DESAS|nr:tyrosine-type recombinase/integrase [Desulfofarcimen acetoxidans]ACV62290.1 integrase family protein [Desulfofarcimen acetoxidans DSM 771]
MARSSGRSGNSGATDGIYQTLLIQFDKVFNSARKDYPGAKSSIYRCKSSMRQFLFFCANNYRMQNIRNIQDKHIKDFIEYRRDQGINEKVIKNDIWAVRLFHRYTPKAKNRISDNEVFGLKSTPDGRVDRAWTEGEFKKMLDFAEKLGRQDVAFTMRLAQHAGLRIHECLRLSKEDAEAALRTGILHVKGKGGRERDLKLSSEALQALSEASVRINNDAGKLFVRPGQKTHSAKKSIEGFISKHRDKFRELEDREKNMTFHGLRHTFARKEYFQRIDRGMDIQRALVEVSRILGHNRPEVTKIYLGTSHLNFNYVK